MQIRRHLFHKIMSIADVDEGSRIWEFGVHEELFDCFRIINRVVSTNAFDLRLVTGYATRGVSRGLRRRRRGDAASRRRHRRDSVRALCHAAT